MKIWFLMEKIETSKQETFFLFWLVYLSKSILTQLTCFLNVLTQYVLGIKGIRLKKFVIISLIHTKKNVFATQLCKSETFCSVVSNSFKTYIVTRVSFVFLCTKLSFNPSISGYAPKKIKMNF